MPSVATESGELPEEKAHGLRGGAGGVGEDVGEDGGLFQRDCSGGLTGDAREGFRQQGDPRACGDHHRDGLSAGGLQDDPGSKSGTPTEGAYMFRESGSGFARHRDKRLGREILKGDLRHPDQAMAGGHKAGERFPAPRRETNPGGVTGGSQSDETAIERASSDGLQLVSRRAVVQHYLYFRMARAKEAEGFDEFRAEDGADEAEAEPAGGPERGAAGGFSSAEELTEDAVGFLVKERTGTGEPDGALGPLEELCADFFLQRADVP